MSIKGGISFYLLDYADIEKSIYYITKANEMGIDEVFTSFQYGNIDDVLHVLSKCQDLNLNVAADINNQIFKKYCKDYNDLSVFKEMGLSGIRLDYGFHLEQLAEMTWNHSNLQIGINALLDNKEQKLFRKIKFNHPNVFASFNYYPRVESGMSQSYLISQSQFFYQQNISLRVFIAGESSKRGPIFGGLPTLEYHRYSFAPSSSSFYHLVKGIDVIYIGDPFIHHNELQHFKRSLDKETIWIKVVPTKMLSEIEYQILFNTQHVLRKDESEWVHRSSAGRLKNEWVGKGECLERPKGSITIDNEFYGRYMGELQIIKKDLPSDERVNLVAKIVNGDQYILEHLTGGMKIQFYK
ncbi:MupG family TIM beta-alpha barrel fold protein [Heyndrickxia sporothermodurans]